jgi:hypothetical protein
MEEFIDVGGGVLKTLEKGGERSSWLKGVMLSPNNKA